MLVRELAAKLSLDVDSASFAKGAVAMGLASAGLTLIVNKAVEVAGEFVHMLKASVAYGDELNDTTQALGISSDALQELRYAGELAGLSTGELDNGIKILTRTNSRAWGSLSSGRTGSCARPTR